MSDIDIIALALRTVRTPEGEQKYGEPIGSVIETDEEDEREDVSPRSDKKADDSASKDQQGGSSLQREKAQKLVDALVERGAEPKQAKAAVQDVQTDAMADVFIQKLKDLSGIPSKQAQLPGAESGGSVASQIGNFEKAAEAYRIVRWRGRELQVPRGARIGQVTGQGDFPAVFYWFDPVTSEVHGLQADGKAMPAVELPAGRSLKDFFTEYVESGGSGFPLKKKKSLGKPSKQAILQGEASNAFT